MPKTVRLADEEYMMVRRAANLHSRSVSSQIRHWMRLGRAVEKMPNYNLERIEQALAAQLPIDDLNTEELAMYLSKLDDYMDDFGDDVSDKYAKLG